MASVGTNKFYKTSMCRAWLKGECTNGMNCRYAHGDEELEEGRKKQREAGIFPPNASNSGSNTNNNNNNNNQTSNTQGLLFKTTLCEKFSKTGHCPYGLKCRFAHGESDLRKKPNFEDPHVKRIFELETENAKLKKEVYRLNQMMGNIPNNNNNQYSNYQSNNNQYPTSQPRNTYIPPSQPQPQVAENPLDGLSNDLIQQSLLQLLLPQLAQQAQQSQSHVSSPQTTRYTPRSSRDDRDSSHRSRRRRSRSRDYDKY